MKRDTIFDHLSEIDTPGVEISGKDGFMSFSKSLPQPKDDSFFDSVKEYGKSALKGITKGTFKLGTSIAPTGLPSQREKAKEKLDEFLEEKLPTEGTFGQRALERGLEELPSSAAFPGLGPVQSITRPLAAGLLGETAKELGGGDIAQTVAELSAYLGPDIFTKLIKSGKNKDIIEAAQSLGMKEEEIAPLLNPEFKKKYFSRMASKTGRTEERFQATREALSKAYQGVKESPQAKEFVPYDDAVKMLGEIETYLQGKPADVAKLIADDYAKLTQGPISGKSLMQFWEAINFQFGKKGGSQLQPMKEFIGKSLEKINPSLRKDFDTLNKLGAAQHKISRAMRPSEADKWFNLIQTASHVPSAIASFFTGNIFPIASTLGLHAAREFASEMVTNPRLVDLQSRFMKQMNDSKYQAARHTLQLISKNVSSDFPDASDMLYEFSKQDFDSLFGGEEQE